VQLTKDFTILIVDDNVDFHTVATATLKRVGYNVLSLYHGEMDYVFESAELCHLILLDVDLPVTKGTEITRQLKSSAQFSAIPIILISGNADLAALWKTSLADSYLGKPFSSPELISEVQRFLI
jgi:CheY-like chemotaxis protein